MILSNQLSPNVSITIGSVHYTLVVYLGINAGDHVRQDFWYLLNPATGILTQGWNSSVANITTILNKMNATIP